MPKKKRAEWSEDDLKKALTAIRSGSSISKAADVYKIPRTTLRLHYRKNIATKRLGRCSILTEEQENELVNRIHRLAEVGLPVTPNIVRRSVFSYARERNIPNPFSLTSKLAGRKWLKLFLKRHPDVARRKAQQMNPARAQKMNPFIVNDYFGKLKDVYTKLKLFDKPGNVYNMDEKGCRLTIHKQQSVLAKRGAKRVHLVAPEHGENVTIVACGNALGQAIPPMIIFKGQRCKPEWGDHLPPGSINIFFVRFFLKNISFYFVQYDKNENYIKVLSKNYNFVINYAYYSVYIHVPNIATTWQYLRRMFQILPFYNVFEKPSQKK